MSRDRRRDDLNDDGVTQRNGIPWYFRAALGPGLGAVLLFWLLGAFPWMPSPVNQIHQAIANVAAEMKKHEGTMDRLLRVNELICRGVWRDAPYVQRECGGGPQRHGDE